MSKEIIINASKDRSRIAIVEDGELVELYVENPDNVRTIGNIYLGRVRKIMPAIRAAFVDIGQQQDAFLHFSDLTDNVPELLAIAAGDIPDARSLMKAPKSLQASEDDDTATADLEMESDDERRNRQRREQTKRRRGRRGGRRRGGRNRGGDNRRSEEEEEESTPRARRTSPYVIDLTSQAAKPSMPARTDRTASSDAATAVPPAEASGNGAEKLADPAPNAEASSGTAPGDEPAGDAKRSTRSRSRRSKQNDAVRAEETLQAAEAPSADTEQAEAPQANATDAAAEEAPAEKRTPVRRSSAPRRRSQRRSERAETESPGAAAPDAATTEASEPEAGTPQNDDAASDADERDAPSRRSRGRGGRRRSEQHAEASAEVAQGEADEETSNDQPAAKAEPQRRSRSGSRRSSRRRPEAQDEVQDTASGDVPAAKQDASKAEPESASPQDSDDQEAASKGGRSRRSRGRRGGRGRNRSRAKAGDAQDDAQQPTSEQKASEQKTAGRKATSRGASAKQTSKSEKQDAPKSSSPRSQRSSKPSGKSSSKESNGEARPIAMVASSKRAEDYLQRDQNILVKIIKEPISAKGSRISTDISLAGRFMVLVPMADYVAVSKKIESSKERRRLRSLASSLRPEGFGIIVRTVADGRDAKALDTDLRLLLDKWRSIEKQLRDKVKPPAALYEDVNMVSSIIRDLFTDDFDRILIDDPKLYRNVKGYIEAVAPQMAKNVQLYKGRQGIYRSASIERSVEEAFSPRVNMRSGGYLFIEHTEAMHVVDVNSGRAGRGKSQAQNLLDVNLEAAREIAKQLRLRDLGGIICVDFIDMRLDSHRRRLYDTLKQEFRKDRAVTKLLPMSDFGVVQITRQRLRPSITADGDGQNGQEAAGAGEIVQSDRTRHEIDRIAREEKTTVVTEATLHEAPVASPSAPATEAEDSRSAAEVVTHLEAWLSHYRDNVGERHKHRPIVVRVHPFMAAFLKRGIPSMLLRWRMRFRAPRFEVDVTDDVNPLTFEVRDRKSGKDLTRKYAVQSGK
ncbi:MAG: Rne/Rng family ribonuclease [Bacteroidota bacterium]